CHDFPGSARHAGLPGLQEASGPERERGWSEMRRMPPCVPHSGRHPDHAGGRRYHRRCLNPQLAEHPAKVQSSVPSRLETTFSVNLCQSGNGDVSTFPSRLPMISPQPFANSWVLTVGVQETDSSDVPKLRHYDCCNEIGCR